MITFKDELGVKVVFGKSKAAELRRAAMFFRIRALLPQLAPRSVNDALNGTYCLRLVRRPNNSDVRALMAWADDVQEIGEMLEQALGNK